MLDMLSFSVASSDKVASISLVSLKSTQSFMKKFNLYYISVSFFFHFDLHHSHSVSNCPDQIRVNDRNQVTIYKVGLLIP